MGKYRKKPVEVEARQLLALESDLEIVRWVKQNGGYATYNPNGGDMFIETLEGSMHARPSDWVIRGVKGEFYPCKSDIFDATHEPVSAPSPEGETP